MNVYHAEFQKSLIVEQFQGNYFKPGFEGVFNANVFSVLAVHIKSRMILFYECTAARFQTFFSGINSAYNYAFVWKMAVLI